MSTQEDVNVQEEAKERAHTKKEMKDRMEHSTQRQNVAMDNVVSYGVAHKKSKITIKRIIIFLACLVVSAAAGLAAWQILREKYTNAIDEQVELLNSRNKNLTDCVEASVGTMKKDFVMEYGGLLTELYGSSNKWQSNLEEVFANQYAGLEDSFGGDFEVSYEVVEETRLTDAQLRKYSEDIRDYLSNGIGEAQESVEMDQMSEKEAGRIIELFEKWYKNYQDVDVTDGYSVIANITYSSGNKEKVVPRRMVVVLMDDEWVVRVGGLVPLDSVQIFENMQY